MELFLVFVLLFPSCFSCSSRVSHKNRAKIVEDYVLSAKFDTKPDLPQLRIDHGKKMLPNEKSRPGFKKKDNSAMKSSQQRYEDNEEVSGDYEGYNALEDREFMVHYHVPPPPPHPLPHPPPPPILPRPAAHLPVAVAFPPFFAVGFIAFLILLNSLQTTLLLTIKNKFGALKPLGRRRRFTHAISSFQ